VPSNGNRAPDADVMETSQCLSNIPMVSLQEAGLPNIGFCINHSHNFYFLQMPKNHEDQRPKCCPETPGYWWLLIDNFSAKK
jgi:hypothetical protein